MTNGPKNEPPSQPPKPTVPEVLPLVNAIYRRHSAGCCWHVVLDDGNCERASVLWCANYARENPCGNPECVELADILPRMSVTQVTKLSRIHV